jgi:hypothetical protein
MYQDCIFFFKMTEVACYSLLSPLKWCPCDLIHWAQLSCHYWEHVQKSWFQSWYHRILFSSLATWLLEEKVAGCQIWRIGSAELKSWFLGQSSSADKAEWALALSWQRIQSSVRHLKCCYRHSSSRRPQLLNIRGPFAKFVDSPYYSELEFCEGAVTVSFSKYLP